MNTVLSSNLGIIILLPLLWQASLYSQEFLLLNLSCLYPTGWPPPAVFWYEGTQLIDGTYNDEHSPATSLTHHHTSRNSSHDDKISPTSPPSSSSQESSKGDVLLEDVPRMLGIGAGVSLGGHTNITKTSLPANASSNLHHGSTTATTTGSRSAVVSSRVSNSLTLPSLTRGDLERSLTCRASNSNGSHPATASVSLDMTRELNP